MAILDPRDLSSRLMAPIDGASLAAFRVGFGLLMAWEAVRYLGSDRVSEYWVEPTWHFHYPGFSWLEPIPGVGMHVLWVVLGLLGLLIAAGVGGAVPGLCFTIGFAYVFLLEPATYLNHLYLVILVSLVLAVSPASRVWTWRRLRGVRGPEQVPAWGLYALRGLVAIVYAWAGLAKMNPDWLRAQPLLIWMEGRSDYPVIGGLLAWDPTAWFMSYAGLGLDLFAAPLLLWRRTRVVAVLLLASFHLTNALIFSIGIFPWLMLAADLLFLDPGWPRRFFSLPAPPPGAHAPRRPRATLVFLGAFFLWQIVVPMRHLVYPGRPSWSEEGHWFAWHMKLRTKRGQVRFRVEDLDSGAERIQAAAPLLSERQARKFKGNPELIRQLAVRIREEAEADGRRVAVYAESRVSLNGRPRQSLVDPEVDLSRVAWTWAPAPWVVPMAHPLPGWDW